MKKKKFTNRAGGSARVHKTFFSSSTNGRNGKRLTKKKDFTKPIPGGRVSILWLFSHKIPFLKRMASLIMCFTPFIFFLLLKYPIEENILNEKRFIFIYIWAYRFTAKNDIYAGDKMINTRTMYNCTFPVYLYIDGNFWRNGMATIKMGHHGAKRT